MCRRDQRTVAGRSGSATPRHRGQHGRRYHRAIGARYRAVRRYRCGAIADETNSAFPYGVLEGLAGTSAPAAWASMGAPHRVPLMK